MVAGGAGDIETLIEYPSTEPRAVAICCHPHPLFGGSLSNKVIHTVARAFLESGAIAIRFNFRGVGASEGVHDHGIGETQDLVTLAAWVRSCWPGLPLWLAGFSFGAWVSLHAQTSLVPALVVSVAPPVGRWDFSSIAKPQCPWLVIQGDRDELVDAVAVRHWLKDLSPNDATLRSLELLHGADHFFHGRLHDVKDSVLRFVTAID